MFTKEEKSPSKIVSEVTKKESSVKLIKKKAHTKSPFVSKPSPDKKTESFTEKFLVTLMQEEKGLKEQIKPLSDNSLSVSQTWSSKSIKVIVKKTLSKLKAQSSKATSSKKALKIPNPFIPCVRGKRKEIISLEEIMFTKEEKSPSKIVSEVTKKESSVKLIKKKAHTKSPFVSKPSPDKKTESFTEKFLVTLMQEEKGLKEQIKPLSDNSLSVSQTWSSKSIKVIVKKTLSKLKAQSSKATSSKKALKIPNPFIPTTYESFMKMIMMVSFLNILQWLKLLGTKGDEINFNENKSFPDDEYLVPRNPSQITRNDDHLPYVPAFDPLLTNNITFLDTVNPTTNNINSSDEPPKFSMAGDNHLHNELDNLHDLMSVIILQLLKTDGIETNINILDEPRAGETTRRRVRDFKTASAYECPYVNSFFKIEPNKVIEALKEEGWEIAMQEKLNQFERIKV
nr:hypothetical protein [Tanacetum cinerariifolium]